MDMDEKIRKHLSLAGFSATLSSTEWMTEIRFDGADRQEFMLQIESPLILKPHEKQSMVLKPSDYSRHLAKTLASGPLDMWINENGSIDVSFADKTLLYVAPSEDFEAWNLTGSDGIKIVSLPGGQISVWET
jgi:hypothetical protein